MSNQTGYSKQDAIMTRGMAIICMIVLHLFCRTGRDVLGTPLLWFDENTPVVYWFGFFAEICVPIYSICVGYGQQYLKEQNVLSPKSNIRRIGKLMLNYWIVLGIFCAISFVFKVDDSIPGTVTDFLKSIVLLHSYNGAWWYLNTYVLLLLIPSKILLWPVKKLEYHKGILCGLMLQIAWYFVKRFGILPDISIEVGIVTFLEKELINLIGILPYIWIGAFICKGKVLEKINRLMGTYISIKCHNCVILSFGLVLFVFTNMVHKAVLLGVVSILSFLLFNLWKKSEYTKKLFLFLGKHSTNIWLTHMFFYSRCFRGLVMIVKYPLFMLLLMFALCIMTSYVIFGIQNLMYESFNKKQKIF